MNRNEFQDRLNYCRRELQWLEAQSCDCSTCAMRTDNICKTYGPIPAEFMAQGCDEWVFDDVPF